ncbi:MAG: FBP domain-containing protein [Dermatophilus congolensis]|nr:FBP domain-containing protein [Dermatophilus congolensis]
MRRVTESEIRGSFVNASRREATQAAMPDLDTLDWDSLDFLGWTDTKFPGRSYVVAHLDGVARGVLLRPAGETKIRRKAMCVWCEDVKATDDVRMVVASLAGAAGRRGATVGTLTCTEFACSRNVRREPSRSEIDDNAGAEERAFWAEVRIEGLRKRVAHFIRRVMRDE